MNELNETTRAPKAPVTHAMPGRVNPQAEHSPSSHRPRESAAPAEAPAGGALRHLVSFGFAVLWLGAVGGYLWGYYGRAGAPAPEVGALALALGIAFVPIFIVAALVEIIAQARKLARLSRHLAKAAQRASEADLKVIESAAQAGHAVRRELDVLAGALDATLARIAAVEEMLDNQVGAIERTGQKAEERVEKMRALLQGERVELAAVADELGKSTEQVAQTLANHVAAARQASLRAEEELRAAEASLSRQIQSFTHAAVEASRATIARLESLKGAADSLESAAQQSLQSADGLAARLSTEQATIAGATERLQEMGRQIESLLAQCRQLIERSERTVSGLVQGVGTTLNEASVRVDAALEGARARAGEASRSLRVEAEAAAAAGAAAAHAIESATAAARRAAEDMRTAISDEISTLAGALSGGTRSLNEVAQTVARDVAGANDAAKRLVTVLDESLQTVERASERLFSVLESITARTSTAQGTLDAASRAMAERLAEMPELAAEHAQRLSALLEDQAQRMGALAQALGMGGKSAAPAPVAKESASRTAPEPSAEPGPAAGAPPAEPEEMLPTPAILRADNEQSARLGPSVRRFSLLRRREAAPPLRRAAQAPEQEAEGTTGGFWSALFSRIEGEGAPARAASAVSETATDLREPAEDFEQSALAVVEGLHALAIDLDRLLEEEPPLELWKRYRSGERNVFARRLLTLKGQGIEERIRQRYRTDSEFRDHADHYLEHFEALLARAREHDRERVLEDTYMSSHTGRLYQLIKDSLGK